jgi:hypothetical protein
MGDNKGLRRKLRAQDMNLEHLEEDLRDLGVMFPPQIVYSTHARPMMHL